jgi:serine/threonine-protein kinase
MAAAIATTGEIEIEMPASAPIPERVGRYLVFDEIASGGMASVYLAIEENDARNVELCAIKRVHPHLAQEREFVEMFIDEARIVTRIRHPNVGAVWEWGESAGSFFLAMELLRGESAHSILRHVGKATALLSNPAWICSAVHIIKEACAGLHAAHELEDEYGEKMHIVHRDVSPHNIFVTWDGTTKVVDFGIASAKHRLHQTTTGMVKGKFAYMAPEQLKGCGVDRRADVWSLGVVLWELLAGRSLFRRKTEGETIFAVAAGEIPTFAGLGLDVPFELEAIVRRALRVNPEKRTASAKDLETQLETWLAGSVTNFEVASFLAEIFPRGREALDERIGRALAGSTSIRPRKANDVPGISRVQRSRKRRHVRGTVLSLLTVIGAVAGWKTFVDRQMRNVWHESALVSVSATESMATPTAESESASATESESASLFAPAPASASDTVHPTPRASPRTGRANASRDEASGVGTIDIATRGGWAEVWFEGRRLGHTPGRFELPAGRHTLVLRRGDIRHHARVQIFDAQLARLHVAFDE